MKLTFLGTSCMVPTKQRNVSGMYLDFEGIGMLFDCGEGSQRQMQIAGINRNSVKYIFISHWHADHVAGLLGLLQTITQAVDAITIVGPIETKKRLDMLLNATIWNMDIEITVIEASHTKRQTVVDTDKFYVESMPLLHGIPCVGYSFVEKSRLRINTAALKKHTIPSGPHLAALQRGEESVYEGKTLSVADFTTKVAQKKFTYIADTKFTPTLVEFAQAADVLVSEATYEDERAQNAEKYFHMTAAQAATIAKDANVGKLYVTHISQRYKKTDTLAKQLRVVFPDSQVAEDFMSVKF